MKRWMTKQLILAGCLLAVAEGYFYAAPHYNHEYIHPLHDFSHGFGAPLAILADAPSPAAAVSRVPLLTVPTRFLPILPQPHVSAVSPHAPYVTCQQNDRYIEAMPAVRVVLDHPLLLSGPEGALSFPSRLEAVHEGVRYSFPVAALIAPVSEPAFGHHFLRVVYAVPGVPEIVHEHPPLTSHLPSVPVVRPADKKRPEVTVLNFPDEVATPPTFSYQSEDEDGLINRNPPQRIVPAGIVQSSQPTPSIQTFVNSKESPHLQRQREQAEKHRDAKPAVESL